MRAFGCRALGTRRSRVVCCTLVVGLAHRCTLVASQRLAHATRVPPVSRAHPARNRRLQHELSTSCRRSSRAQVGAHFADSFDGPRARLASEKPEVRPINYASTGLSDARRSRGIDWAELPASMSSIVARTDPPWRRRSVVLNAQDPGRSRLPARGSLHRPSSARRARPAQSPGRAGYPCFRPS